METERARQLLARERARIEEAVAAIQRAKVHSRDPIARSRATRVQMTSIRMSSTEGVSRTSTESSPSSSARSPGCQRRRTVSRSRAGSRFRMSGWKLSRRPSGRSRRSATGTDEPHRTPLRPLRRLRGAPMLPGSACKSEHVPLNRLTSLLGKQPLILSTSTNSKRSRSPPDTRAVRASP